jgi:transmembrane sensor
VIIVKYNRTVERYELMSGKNNMGDQRNQKLEDFVLNESFRDYVLGSDDTIKDFWMNWLKTNPNQKEEFEKAVIVLKMLLNIRKPAPLNDKNNELKKLLRGMEMPVYQKRQRWIVTSYPWRRIAAAVVVIFLLSLFWRLVFTPLSTNNRDFYEVIVPIGEKSQIILPDGTHVWINSESRLVYPAKYGVANRQVYLEGEAYFDVTKQKNNMPFMVNTRDLKVKVLGTAFNVKSYDADNTVETTVVRGLVEVESVSGNGHKVRLNPYEKVVFVKRNQPLPISDPTASKKGKKTMASSMIIMKTNPEIVTCWKDQLLMFTDETFEEMVVKMERWYNIKIHLSDSSLRNERFNGKFVHNETVYQVLEAVRLTTPIKYTVMNNEIIISRK